MDIHRPKGVHDWREFAKEVGIIVLGVLIALGAEQTVETFHWRHKVAEAEQAMKLELRDDDVPQAYTRVALEPCLAARLEAVQAAVEAGRDRREVATLVSAYAPPNRTWDSEAWKAAVASDAGSHMSADRLMDWSKPYRWMPGLQMANTREHTDLVALTPARHAAGRVTPGEEDTILAAVQRLRSDSQTMTFASRILLVGSGRIGAGLRPERQRAILRDLRAHYGACVVEPSTAGLDPTDQLREVYGQ